MRSEQDAEGNDIRGLAEFIIAKHRSGSVDDVKLRFQGRYARFENWSESSEVTFTTVGSRLNSENAMGGMSADPNPLMGGNADFLSSTNEELPPF